jgi:hypothetical protein
MRQSLLCCVTDFNRLLCARGGCSCYFFFLSLFTLLSRAFPSPPSYFSDLCLWSSFVREKAQRFFFSDLHLGGLSFPPSLPLFVSVKRCVNLEMLVVPPDTSETKEITLARHDEQWY